MVPILGRSMAPLLDYENVSASVVDLNARVSDYILEAGSWNSSSLFAQVPLEAANKILGYPLPKWKYMADSYVWSLTSKGMYSSQSAYARLVAEETSGENVQLGWLWKLPIPAGPLVHFSVASMAR